MSRSARRRSIYIQLLSIHGLIRGRDPELGRDPDTGGQVLYVLELARALAAHPDVDRVDLITRRIVDSRVSDDYAREVEELTDEARIVRLDCGPKRYLRKEQLWPHLDTLADRILRHTRSVGRAPDLIHSHYADAGHVGTLISSYLGIPLVHTGHSLGRVKRARLLEKGMAQEKIESRYNIARRIEAEESTLDNASLVIASTHQEVDEQYALYDRYEPGRMRVLPPGVNLERFHPAGRGSGSPPIAASVDRFLRYPRRPMILALSRADSRKNVAALVRAYARHEDLRHRANLVLVLGNRDDIRELDREAQEVLGEILHLVDLHDLYGHVAYPKHHRATDVPDLYRLAAVRRGVFVNPALTEPFGLTLIEAAGSGLPIVATEDGGPRDILKNCRNGMLVDPLDTAGIGSALSEAISDRSRWKAWATAGLRGAQRHYTWKGHVANYMNAVRPLIDRQEARTPGPGRRGRLAAIDRLFVTDLDNTLLGDLGAAADLMLRIAESSTRTGFAVATGRNIDSARKVLVEWNIPEPEVWITSVGAEIHYGRDLVPDAAWERHTKHRWSRDAVLEALAEVPGLTLQGDEGQRPHKVSYDVDPERCPRLREIKQMLRRSDITANIVYSHGAFLDVLPTRTSKGKALRFLAYKWGLPFDRILVAGDSGNDEEMLRGETLAVVVGNHSRELAKLRGRHRVYFAEAHYAAGILEGMKHYRFLDAEWPSPESTSDPLAEPNLENRRLEPTEP